MRITRIRLVNWKNFRDVEVELGGRVFLIGPNASGKSNFLDAIRFLRDVAESDLEKAVKKRGGISAIRCLAARQNPDVTIAVTLDDTWEYELTFRGKKNEAPEVVSEQVQKKHDESLKSKRAKLLSRPDAYDREDPERLNSTALAQVNANKSFRDIPDGFKTIAYRHILPQALRDPEGFSSVPVSNDPFGRDFVRQVWNTLPATRKSRLKKISDALRIAVPQLHQLDVGMDQKTGVPHLTAIYQHWRLHGARQSESEFSDGTLRLLALLWALCEGQGPLLLEEPELSLHDDVVRYLPSIFAKMTRVRKKGARQILVSTHSEVLLSDAGIGPGEVLRLAPGNNGTEIYPAGEEDRELMQGGLSAAEVLLPKTKPENINQLSFFDL